MDMFYCWIMWVSLEVDVEEDLVHAADSSGCCPIRPPFSSKQHALVGCTGDCKGTTRAAVGFLVGFHPAATHMPRLTLEDVMMKQRDSLWFVSALLAASGTGWRYLQEYLLQV
jgi:hypothetical protein